MRGEAHPVWREDLNPEQLEAVTYGEGPLLVFAGAGSGKTRVITYRIMHLVLERSVPPGRILGLTFTNKAAAVMRERVERHLPGAPFLGTFHSFCARILRIHGEGVGIPGDFAIYDDDDQLSLVRRVIADLDLDTDTFSPRSVRGWIDALKRVGLVPDAEDHRAGIFEAYEAHLARQHALDFNDLLLKAVGMLERSEAVRSDLAGRYRYVLVDEFQDTNRVQLRLLTLLAPAPSSICVVGDDDQSIYGWRGAQVRNILDFRAHYPTAHTVTLERNYRSTGNILAAAAAVIHRNADRAPKTLWTSEGPGDPIEVISAPSEIEEARLAALAIRRLSASTPLSRQAVLYRIHAQSRALEEALREAGVPYRIVGGTRFFDRAEIRDLVAYLRLARNPMDDVAFLRVVNTPGRGVGPRAIEQLRETRVPLVEAAGRMPRTAAFAALVRSLHETAGPPAALLGRIVDEVSYLEHLRKAHGEEAEARILNVRELVAFAGGFEDLDSFLERVALITDLDQLGEDQEAVTLMTVHSAKGMEFDSVIVTGLEEDLFPFRPYSADPAYEERAEMEEERRLFYVAVTRARSRLALAWARSRRLFGAERFRSPSPFLDDIPPAVLKAAGSRRPARRAEPDSQEPEPGPAAGARVRHRTFGLGRVVRVEEGIRRKVVVRFDDGKTRKILEDFVTRL